MWSCGVAWHLLFRGRDSVPGHPNCSASMHATCHFAGTQRATSRLLADTDRREMTGLLEHGETDLLGTFEAEAPQTGEQLVAAHVFGLERILDHATIDDERARFAAHELAQHA